MYFRLDGKHKVTVQKNTRNHQSKHHRFQLYPHKKSPADSPRQRLSSKKLKGTS